ncbi:MAG: hypothetical protein M3305_13665 [Actinomycetota bacterium]|nr:hypothetical protein [Actinomycetota bacterium]
MVITSPEDGSQVPAALPGWRAIQATLHPLDPNIRLLRVGGHSTMAGRVGVSVGG